MDSRFQDLLRDIGKAGVNAMFPNDFEYYALTIELVDSKGRTVMYLTFPVNPDSIVYDNVTVTSVKKTMGGTSTLDNETFVPKTISIQGTFGRKFKLLIAPPILPDANINSNPGLQIKELAFDPKLKTGYGVMKLLEKMIDRSSTLDQYNQPYRLYFYNPTLNHNFWVKATRHLIQQDKQSSNMLWKYDIQLTAIAPLDRIVELDKGSLLLRTSLAALQSNLNKITKNLRNEIS